MSTKVLNIVPISSNRKVTYKITPNRTQREFLRRLRIEKPITIYRCTWRDNQNVRCNEIGYTWDVVAAHVLEVHLGGKKTYENEEDFYIVDEQIINTSLPPTKSHWDMVRPRSEDPEYQKQIRHSSTLVPSTSAQSTQAAAAVNTQDIIIRDVIPMTSSNQPAKQFKPSPPSRPVPQQQQLQQQPQQQPQQPQQQQQQQYSAPNISVVTVSLGKMPQSPQKVRGDTKKCRKVYGMEKRDTAWCKQCKWKKACSRFVD